MLGEMLRRFGWKNTFSMVPLFFSGLCISPNFDQNRLVIALITFLLFFIPSWNFISGPNPSGKFSSQFPGLIWAVLGLFIGGMSSYWFVVSMALTLILSLIIQTIRPVNPSWLQSFALGVISIFILYLGLNDYEPGQLAQSKVILMALVSGLWCAYTFLYQSNRFNDTPNSLKWLALIWIPALYLSIGIIFDRTAAGLFLLPALVISVLSAIRILVSAKEKQIPRLLLNSFLPALSQLTYIGFLIYFFLNNTHVLQVFG